MRNTDLEKEVESILQENEKSREDDMLLYFQYVTKRNQANFVDVFVSREVRDKYKISSFESVARCRRKLQVKRKDLRAPEKIRNDRHAKQNKMFDYAVGNE